MIYGVSETKLCQFHSDTCFSPSILFLEKTLSRYSRGSKMKCSNGNEAPYERVRTSPNPVGPIRGRHVNLMAHRKILSKFYYENEPNYLLAT